MERFRQAAAKRLRHAETGAEARLWQALRNRRLATWKFRRQHPIDRFVVDFVTIAGRLIVELDGATHSRPREIARDDERTRVLESLGYRVVRVMNVDVHENIEGVIDGILSDLSP
ncbi:MAG: DUF559 domain-containing protein [Bauldia sp.]|nr:DUF559 domain-containing protein [Bauldia sp.]